MLAYIPAPWILWLGTYDYLYDLWIIQLIHRTSQRLALYLVPQQLGILDLEIWANTANAGKLRLQPSDTQSQSENVPCGAGSIGFTLMVMWLQLRQAGLGVLAVLKRIWGAIHTPHLITYVHIPSNIPHTDSYISNKDLFSNGFRPSRFFFKKRWRSTQGVTQAVFLISPFSWIDHWDWSGVGGITCLPWNGRGMSTWI